VFYIGLRTLEIKH